MAVQTVPNPEPTTRIDAYDNAVANILKAHAIANLLRQAETDDAHTTKHAGWLIVDLLDEAHAWVDELDAAARRAVGEPQQ